MYSSIHPFGSVTTLVVVSALTLAPITSGQVQDLGADEVRRFFLSTDGSAGAGQLIDDNGVPQVFRWTSSSGVTVLLTPTGEGGSPRAVSREGSVVCGSTIAPGDTKRAIRWDATGSALDLTPAGALGSIPNAMSDDGLTVALTVATSDGSRAAIWTPILGTIDLHPLTGSDQSEFILLSGDGSTAVGARKSANGQTLGFFTWSTSSGVVDFDQPGGAVPGPTSISFDGSFISGIISSSIDSLIYRWSASNGFESSPTILNSPIAGTLISPDGSVVYGALPDTLGGPSSQFFAWAPPAAVEIVTPPMPAILTDSTFDGSIIAGTMAPSQAAPGRAFHYSVATGVVDLTDYPGLWGATSISDDGSWTGGTYEGSEGGRAVRWSADGSLGESYCGPGVPNSSGASGTMRLGGTNISELASVVLEASNLPQDTFGFFIASSEAGFAAQPGGSQGNLCLGGAIGRFIEPNQIQNSGASGVISIEIDPRALPGPGGPILPNFGGTWHFQAWHRDANPGITSNFTDAVVIDLF
ncbi:MAG: hypothetical protein AAGG01_00785 [Planctomycetota bacterium]